jgi:hypothetical protein
VVNRGVWGHNRELCKNSLTDRVHFCTADGYGPAPHRIRFGSRSPKMESFWGNRGVWGAIVNCAKKAERIELIFTPETGPDLSNLLQFLYT